MNSSYSDDGKKTNWKFRRKKKWGRKGLQPAGRVQWQRKSKLLLRREDKRRGDRVWEGEKINTARHDRRISRRYEWEHLHLHENAWQEEPSIHVQSEAHCYLIFRRQVLLVNSFQLWKKGLLCSQTLTRCKVLRKRMTTCSKTSERRWC